MHIGSHNPEQLYTLNGTPVEAVAEERDLGVVIDRQLKFHTQTAAAVSKVSQMLAVVRRSFANIDETTLPLLFKSMVRPFLEYGNTIWGPFGKTDQKQRCTVCSGVRRGWWKSSDTSHTKKDCDYWGCHRYTTAAAGETWWPCTSSSTGHGRWTWKISEEERVRANAGSPVEVTKTQGENVHPQKCVQHKNRERLELAASRGVAKGRSWGS